MNNIPTPRTEAVMVDPPARWNELPQLARRLETELSKVLRERDEAREAWYEMQSSFERSRDEVEKLIRERDEARGVAKEAINGLYNLGDYDLANRLASNLEKSK